jgi:hypothetical protein
MAIKSNFTYWLLNIRRKLGLYITTASGNSLNYSIDVEQMME